MIRQTIFLSQGLYSLIVMHGLFNKVLYYFSDGTAVGGSQLNDKTDYISQSGTLQFNHSETSKTITIEVNKNSKVG